MCIARLGLSAPCPASRNTQSLEHICCSLSTFFFFLNYAISVTIEGFIRVSSTCFRAQRSTLLLSLRARVSSVQIDHFFQKKKFRSTRDGLVELAAGADLAGRAKRRRHWPPRCDCWPAANPQAYSARYVAIYQMRVMIHVGCCRMYLGVSLLGCRRWCHPLDGRIWTSILFPADTRR